MKRTRSLLFPGTLGVVVVLALLAGCYRPAAPNVTLTPVEEAEVVPSDEDVAATAVAEATRAAAATEETEAAPTETPVPPSPEPTAESQPTAEAPSPTPVPEPTQTEPAPTPTSSAADEGTTGTVTHVVQRGENLFRIALRYGTTVQAIASANGIANSGLVHVGQTLTIPSSGDTQPDPAPAGGATYVVQPGDNLFRIALRYGISHLYLAQYNGIANPASIYVGQVLRIPPD